MKIRKIFVTIVTLLFLANSVSAIELVESETNSTYDKILQAHVSNDVQTIVQAVAEIEKLWPQHPEIYFKTVKEAATVLGNAGKTPEANQALLKLWTNIVQKPLPADDRAVNCIGLKRDAIYSFLDFDYISNDKSRWIDFANFIGEIRSQIIPNYTNQSEMISVLAISPSAKQQLQKELEENERKAITDRLQLELRSTNRELTKYLVRNIPSRLHKDAEFIVAVSAAARLSKEEANELKGKID